MEIKIGKFKWRRKLNWSNINFMFFRYDIIFQKMAKINLLNELNESEAKKISV